MTEPIRFYCEDEELNQLERRDPLDGGLDIRCMTHSITVPARESVLVPTGLHVAIPPGYVGIIKSRSGIATRQFVEAGAGVIDSPYRGEVKVLLHNLGDRDATFQYGDRIAQLVVIKLCDAEVIRVNSPDLLGVTDRGTNGFGSSGLK